MKRKIIHLIILTLSIFTLTGCFENDELEGSNITTTIYPIEYLVTRLYGYNSKISSIYPNDTDVSEYSLTDKQKKDYANKTDLFVYNGLSDEKEIAKSFVNLNKNIQIIDASYTLKYTYGVEELWLNPNNYLMLANTIKTDLEDLSSSKYTAEKIEENFNSLEEDLSKLDAEFRSIAQTAERNDNNTIVIAYNTFAYLEKYGFNIINISNENNITTNIKNKFKNKTYKYILVADKDNVSDSVKDLVDNYEAELIEIDTMTTLTDDQRKNNDTYLTIMNEFITKLSDTVLNQ